MIYEDVFFEALENNDLNRIKEIIKFKDVKKDDLTEFCETACSSDTFDIAKYLIEEKFIVPSAFALQIAIFRQDIKIIKLILNVESLDPTDGGRNSGLLYAYRKNEKELMALLFSDKRIREYLEINSSNTLQKKKIFEAYKLAHFEYNIKEF